MNLIADESVDRPIVEYLRKTGYSVDYIADSAPGVTDDAVLQQARDNDALLLTLDKDFGELVSMALNKHKNELQHSFSVLTPTTLRIRKAEL